ncbi:MAG TPA: SGNH/GDSL hydrolase family protein [Gammaproteobacteria bacterium]|nr:SGNH/GDSL hydrolase family protein [Gammaproteobacteria bacterium]
MLLRMTVVAISATLVALVCEAALSWLAPIGDPFVTNNPSLNLLLHPNPEWMPNMLSPARFTTDEQGFRVSHPIDYRDKPPRTFRVFLIGGSTTENLYIDDSRTFGAILERRLNETLRPADRSAEVINAGRGGTGSADHFYLARQVVAYQPDVIVYLLGVNDMVPYLRNGFQPFASETKARLRSWLLTSQLGRRAYVLFRVSSAAGQIIRDPTGAFLVPSRAQSQRAPLKPMPDAARKVSDAYRHNIRLLFELHRRYRLPAVFMTQPALWHADMRSDLEQLVATTPGGGAPFRYSTGGLDALMNAYNDVLRTEVATEPLASLADLARLLRKDDTTFYDDVHFTDAVQETIADILFSSLRQSGLISPLEK